ncbi:MAG: transposase [Chloroflexi bacterium]|nr:transposase [Chloroflexota bacterium]
MQRTIRLRLDPTAEQRTALLATLQQHAACFNTVAAYGWEQRQKNGVALHKATYYPLRSAHPELPAQLVVSARVRATEAVKSALALLRQERRVRCPIATLPPIRYDARSYRLRVSDNSASLASIAGRQWVAFRPHPHAAALLAQATGFDSADLIYRKGRFWLHAVVTLPDVAFAASGVAVGVDLGLNRPAVASNNRFFGSRRWRGTDHRHFRVKRQLQAKGTRSAKRRLRRLAGKVNRFRRDCDHVLSRRIVQSVPPGTTIVVENLTNIRVRVKQRGREANRRLHGWSFAQLRALLTYKAEAAGCMVVGVDPRHTSQQCSRCGYVHRSNRRSPSRFVCRECRFELNADLNASRNIAQKYLAGVGRSDPSGPPSTGLSCQSAGSPTG